MNSLFVQAWRSWRSARSVFILATFALGIGIGSATAIYSVVQAVILNPLPWNSPERYYQVFGAWKPHPEFWTSFSYPDIADYTAGTHTLEAFGCYRPFAVNASFMGPPSICGVSEPHLELFEASIFQSSPAIGSTTPTRILVRYAPLSFQAPCCSVWARMHRL